MNLTEGPSLINFGIYLLFLTTILGNVRTKYFPLAQVKQQCFEKKRRTFPQFTGKNREKHGRYIFKGTILSRLTVHGIGVLVLD